MPEVRKVYAYIVQDGEIVVFEQPHSPEAGVQVPGGTVDDDESLMDAVLREAFEETGLKGLAVVRYLGMHEFDLRDYGRDECHQRHFYHLACATPIPSRWQHMEQFPSEGPARAIPFDLYRVPLATVPDLIADMDVFIEKLRGLLS